MIAVNGKRGVFVVQLSHGYELPLLFNMQAAEELQSVTGAKSIAKMFDGAGEWGAREIVEIALIGARHAAKALGLAEPTREHIAESVLFEDVVTLLTEIPSKMLGRRVEREVGEEGPTSEVPSVGSSTAS